MRGPMFINMPPAFPQDGFQEFARYATARLPDLFNDDEAGRRQHFDRSWMAVHYRYRMCWEYNEEFKGLLASASDLWREWNDDEEQNYKLERCLYGFFLTALSVLESFGFCLYFAGAAVRRDHFPLVAEPGKIKLKSVAEAFKAAFPEASVTRLLCDLLVAPQFKKLSDVRNILAHRLAGRRSVRTDIFVSGGTCTEKREETWHLPGSEDKLIFSGELLQQHLDETTCLLTQLLEASVEFLRGSARSRS